MINKEAEKLGEYIKKLRKEKKVTAKELGSYVGYSQSYISALENNNNNNVPSKKVLDRLATALWHIGHNHSEVKKTLYEIAGYPSPTIIKGETNFKESYLRYLGSYDNISNTPLEKPYLDLSYLLTNNFNLRFQYKNNGYDEHVDITDRQKAFINNMINQLLLLDGIEEEIEAEYNKRLEEQRKINDELFPYQSIEEKLKHLQLDLRTLNKLKKDFSEEAFKYDYDFKIKVLRFEDEEKIDFSKKTLLKAIDYITEEITRLTIEYDNLDKED